MADNEAASGINVLYIAYIENKLKSILVRCQKGLIFYIKHQQVVLYQVCSNYGSVVKWHRPGGHRIYEAVIVL